MPPEEIENWIQVQTRADGTSDWIALALPPGHRVIYDVDNPYRPAVVPPWETTITEAVEHGRWPTLHYGLPDEEERQIAISAGGVLEELARVSDFLSEAYCWTQAQAVLFLLTGETPRLTRIRQAVRYRLPQALTRITLEIDPTVSPREVAEWYSIVRTEIVGGRHRDQSDKHLKLAEFATTRPVGETWRASKTRWNTAFPTWSYSGVQNFERDAKAAVQRLVEPNFEMPIWVFEEE